MSFELWVRLRCEVTPLLLDNFFVRSHTRLSIIYGVINRLGKIKLNSSSEVA